MGKDTFEKLRILHLAADPEFISPAFVGKYEVEIPTIDNVFSSCQWVLENGLPDAVVFEPNFPTGDRIGFQKFWNEQIDLEQQVPFLVLEEEKNSDNVGKTTDEESGNGFRKPLSIENLVSRILTLKEERQSISRLSDKEPIQDSRYKTPILKRTIDIIAASLVLLIISPFLLIFAIAIKLESRGKVYYISKRLGSGFHLFDYYQLRTRYVSSDKRLKKVAHLNQIVKEASAPNAENTINEEHSKSVQTGQKSKETAHMKFEVDPRISKVGHVLCKLHFDELPQLINVIKGDLTIVGNRPLKIYEGELLSTEDLTNRMYGPAGITGLWKLKSRKRLRRMSREEVRALDNKYYKIARRKFSVWSDLWIIARTMPVILRRGKLNE